MIAPECPVLLQGLAFPSATPEGGRCVDISATPEGCVCVCVCVCVRVVWLLQKATSATPEGRRCVKHFTVISNYAGLQALAQLQAHIINRTLMNAKTRNSKNLCCKSKRRSFAAAVYRTIFNVHAYAALAKHQTHQCSVVGYWPWRPPLWYKILLF
jgi:hypothetical protein